MELGQTESLKRLKAENFIKEHVSLIWFLLTIFTAAAGRILTVSCASYCACGTAATEIQINFGPHEFCGTSPAQFIQQP
jgi:hypothetical protein